MMQCCKRGSDNLSAYFGPPSSPGVTSILRDCFGDGDVFDEADSSCVFQGVEHQAGTHSAAADCALAQPPQAVLQAEGENIGNAQVPEPTPSHRTPGSSPPHLVGTSSLGGASWPSTSQAAAFNLGDSAATLQVPSACGVAVRRRGRKPKPRLPDLQHKLDDLTKQYQRLSHENASLKNKLKVLERVVPYRDESVGFLTQLFSLPVVAHGAQEGPESRAAVTAHVSRHDQAQSAFSSGDSGLSSEHAVGCGSESKSSLAHATANSTGGTSVSGDRGVSCSSKTMRDGRTVLASAAAAEVPGLRKSFATNREASASTSARSGLLAVIALCPSPDGEAPAITAAALEELKRTSGQEFRMLWKHICLQLGVLVTGAEVHGPGSSPYVRLERFLERALAYMDKITLLSPACFVQSMYMNVETGQPERPSDTFWITCARALQLTPHQLAEVNTLAGVYEHEVVPVVQQRLQLSMQLSASLAVATNQTSGGMGDALMTLPAVDELARQLERNVLKEHQAHWNIGDFLCSSVLTPLQVAKALTVAYPYIPDGVAMLHAFKLLRAGEEQQAFARPQQLGAASQAFPSLASLLVSKLPGLAGIAAATGRPGPPAVQLHGHAGRPNAAFPIVATGLQPGQLQALMGALQPGQLQALMGALHPAQMQADLSMLQAVSLSGRLGVQQAQAAQPPAPNSTTEVQSGILAAAQVQGLAMLLGAVACSRQRN